MAVCVSVSNGADVAPGRTISSFTLYLPHSGFSKNSYDTTLVPVWERALGVGDHLIIPNSPPQARRWEKAWALITDRDYSYLEEIVLLKLEHPADALQRAKPGGVVPCVSLASPSRPVENRCGAWSRQ